MRDVDHLDVWRDALDHAATRSREVVLEAEVGQEGDELACDAASLTAATRPSRSWLSASATTSRPGVARLRRSDRPDAHAGEVAPKRGECPRGRRRGEHDQVGVGERRDLQLDGAIERHELGAELADEHVAGVLGGRVQDAARRLRELVDEPLLGRALGDEGRLDAVSPERLCGPRADRRDPAGRALESPQKRLDCVPAGNEDPVVALGLDAAGPSISSMRISGTATTSKPSARSRSARRSSVPVTTTLTAPRRGARQRERADRRRCLRSIQAPSSAAISAVSASPS